MILDWRVRLGLVITGGVLVGLALAGAAWGRLDLGAAMQALTGFGALLAGVGLAGGKGPGVLLFALALSTAACGGIQRPGACATERVIVDALGAGLGAADAMVGDRGGENYDIARTATLGAHQLGDVAVDACELLRDGAGWQAWVALALEAAGSLAAAIDGHGPEQIEGPVPEELRRAITLLEAERI